ncbi:MAG: peptidase domain-containing ABC transporter [Bacteroidales bacterium]
MKKSYPFYLQLDSMDCGATCLRMLAKYYGKHYTLESLREKTYITREGVSLLGISEAAEKLGFRTTGVHVSFEQLATEATFPCIVHWKQQHFVVVYDIKQKHSLFQNKHQQEEKENDYKITIADPAHGIIIYNKQEFLNSWLSSKDEKGKEEGIALLLEPGPEFLSVEDEKQDRTKLKFIFQYLRPYKKLIIQLVLGMGIGTLLQAIFPFLTQSIVDYGIGNNNPPFIILVLIAQLVLYITQTGVDFVRSWILLHITTRVNISIISDFLFKLMKLPIGFFDSKKIGDIMQRIGDHYRIESFLTTSTLNTLFSTFSFVVFACILAFYNIKLLIVFCIASVLYVLWILLFMKRRRDLDFKRFAQAANEQSTLFQLITGMQEIKLNNCEKQKRWEWESIQAKLFKISIKGLALSQYQQSGAFFINETKNILISFFAAYSVIQGDMTLGMLTAVQYIIGQLNSPLNQVIGFIQSAQDAKISLERLGEIHQKDDEENDNEEKLSTLPEEKSISMEHLSFSYTPLSPEVLQDISLLIPQGKVTAIVGMSGSGKTTLLKLMLGFYPPNQGSIKVGETSLSSFSPKLWRAHCGVVMQDGFIFSDTIAKNIAVGVERIDKSRLLHAVHVANIEDLIQELPLGFNTQIGQEGNGISQGQKQRILIARTIYKNPDYLFFDEATNALDANNEKVIMENLQTFFEGRTVVIVAHRLSTVKNADQIVVLNRGKITEIGTHKELAEKRGEYYELVKNQLELGQ